MHCHISRRDTVEKLSERRNGKTLRKLAIELGYPESYAATLSDVLKRRPGSLSREGELELRRRLGMTDRRRVVVRVGGATPEQRATRQRLGVSWADVIAAGLAALTECQNSVETTDDRKRTVVYIIVSQYSYLGGSRCYYQ